MAKHSKPVPKRADKQKEPIRQKRPRSDSSKSAVGSSLFTNDPSSYSLSKTLVVGDGDFSFSLALAQQWQNVLPSKRRLLVCSSYDSYESVKRKYGEIKMDRAIRSLADILKQDHRDSNQRLDITEEKGKVLHGIDATQLGEYFPPGSFNRIIFNFPHCGSQRVVSMQRFLILKHCQTFMLVVILARKSKSGISIPEVKSRSSCQRWPSAHHS